jgi:SagB-type dehydrogenase family enzyme
MKLIDRTRIDAADVVDTGLPVRPRFLRELVVAKTDQGLVVDGGSRLHVLWGDVARNLLPVVIPLMDGSRTISEIASSFPGFSVEQVRDALSSLCSWGLVEEGTEPAIEADGQREAMAFFRRYGAKSAPDWNSDRAFADLAAQEIVIVSFEQQVEDVEYFISLLTAAGAKQVRHIGWESIRTLESRESSAAIKRLAITLCLENENCGQLAEFGDFCSSVNLPWLRIAMNKTCDFADMGPLFSQGKSPCYRCFARTHFRRSPRQEHRESAFASGNRKFWIGLAATEVLYRLTNIGSPKPDTWFRRYTLSDWTGQPLSFAAIPGCLSCRPHPDRLGPDQEPVIGDVDTAVVFEDYVANRSAPSMQSETWESDSQALAELTRQSKSMPNCKQHKLPATFPHLNHPILNILPGKPVAHTRLSIEEIGSLLMMTAGIRRSVRKAGMVKRWAATAGNLGSVELFVAIRRVEGLSPGFYYYQNREHTLASYRKHRGSISVEEFMTRVGAYESSGLPDVVVLFTGAYHRVATKYGPFAYRLINLDAGVAISQMRMIAACMGITSRVVHRWADDLIEDQLALDPMMEQSTAVLSLYRDEADGLSSRAIDSDAEIGHPASLKPPGEFCDLSLVDIVRRVYEESRITESELCSKPFVVPTWLRGSPRAASETHRLPIPGDSGVTLGEGIQERKSIRHYKRDSVILEQIAAVLSFSQRADAAEWPEEQKNGLALNFVILAERVTTIEPGVYEYDSAQRCLELSRGVLLREELIRLYVQEEFARAPLAIWITGNLAVACARNGAFGHRQLLLRAGAAGNRLWLAASGIGLAGCLVAGIKPDAAKPILGLDGYLKSALFAVTIGYAAHRSQSGDEER